MSALTKVIVIDDNQSAVTVLANELKAYKDVEVVATALNSTDGEKAILKHKPHLLFLDIELPGITGLEFLVAIRTQISWEMSVVFYTSYEKYMLQAFRIQAFDFLLKPVSPEELLLVMNRYYLSKKNNLPAPPIPPTQHVTDKPLLITTITNDKIIVRPQNIGYFRYNSDRKLWEVVLDDFRHIILRHNTTSEAILNYSDDFIQIHKTYIININYLGIIQESTCVMLYPFNTVAERKVSKIYRKKLFDEFYSL